MDQDYNKHDDKNVENYSEQEYRTINSVKEHQGHILALRQELSEYVEDLNGRKDADGNSFLKMPSNFDAIVCSMTREDINIEPENGIPPWSQYLLLDSLNAESDADYNGRYAKVFSDTPDVKIKRGLAQIEMLDRQLRDASKKTPSIDPDDVDVDQTFVTIGQKLTTESPRDSDSKIPVSSRSGKNSIITIKKLAVTSERELRLQRLLDCTEGEDLENVLGTYLDVESQEQLLSIDSQLAQFGRLGLLPDGDGTRKGPSERVAKRLLPGLPETEQPDYLTQQRLARETKEDEARIDSLLRECRNQPIMYEALVENAFGGAAVDAAPSLSEVPPVQQVDPQRPITHQHIQQLLVDLSTTPQKPTSVVENPAAIRDLVRNYQREVDALALVRQRLRSGKVNRVEDRITSTPLASPPRDMAVRNTGIVQAASLLDYREEAPQCALNMAHPAVYGSAFCSVAAPRDVDPYQQDGGQDRWCETADDLSSTTGSPHWNLRMHLHQEPAGSRGVRMGKDAAEVEGEELEGLTGWLPPLPPRSGSGPSREPVQDVPVRRSPPKSIRLTTRSSPAPVTVFRTSQLFAAKADDASQEDQMSKLVHNNSRQDKRAFAGITSLHRANRASNVLNSMSSLLAKEMLQQQPPLHKQQSTGKQTSMRI